MFLVNRFKATSQPNKFEERILMLSPFAASKAAQESLQSVSFDRHFRQIHSHDGR